MSLPILVVVVAVGIALVVAAVHFTGGNRVALLHEEADARRRFAEDFPDEQVEGVHLTQARRSAFLKLRNGRVGVVQGVGGHFLTRIITPADLVRASFADPATVSIHLRDFTWPGGDFRFADQAEALAVLDMLAPGQDRERQEVV